MKKLTPSEAARLLSARGTSKVTSTQPTREPCPAGPASSGRALVVGGLVRGGRPAPPAGQRRHGRHRPSGSAKATDGPRLAGGAVRSRSAAGKKVAGWQAGSSPLRNLLVDQEVVPRLPACQRH